MVLTKNFAREVPGQLVTKGHKGLIKNVKTQNIQNQIKKNSQLVTKGHKGRITSSFSTRPPHFFPKMQICQKLISFPSISEDQLVLSSDIWALKDQLVGVHLPHYASPTTTATPETPTTLTTLTTPTNPLSSPTNRICTRRRRQVWFPLIKTCITSPCQTIPVPPVVYSLP